MGLCPSQHLIGEQQGLEEGLRNWRSERFGFHGPGFGR